MDHQILDSDEIEWKPQNNRPQFFNWISIIILWLGIAYCGINGLLGEFKVLAAVVLLILATAVTYSNYELGVKITLGIILAGFLNAVDFFPIKISFIWTIVKLEIVFELILFLVGIIHIATNRKVLSTFIKSLFNPTTKKEKQADEHSNINGFKRRFAKKPISELERIANNSQLLPAAIKAAKELIEENKSE